MSALIGINHACRMHWPPGHRGIQFAVHWAPGWSSLSGDRRWWRTLTLEAFVWRVDLGLWRDE